MAEFVVAPSRAMTKVRFVNKIDIVMLVNKIINVHIIFFAFVKGVPRTSSIETFVGRTQKGVANITTRHIPNSEM